MSSDELIIFCEESIEKMADGGHFEKIALLKACGRNILWTVNCIQICFTDLLGISNDQNNFWE